MTEDMSSHGCGLTLYTIGFGQKSARRFFSLLAEAGVRRVVDIRLNNVSQLAGFTKRDDLAFFLERIGGMEYEHRPELAPTKDILDSYKKKRIDWQEYENRFRQLMMERSPETFLSPDTMNHACLLCSEPKPDRCHRRLVAEYCRSYWPQLTIRHL
ncbi:MAG: DUF488 domain-containing protein [Dehalococcoidia bacterium]|jgi:uncharacterized protein (DUF488 family)|nr:DUF488 domain-containing protein [Dehalococcoidia bacterium]